MTTRVQVWIAVTIVLCSLVLLVENRRAFGQSVSGDTTSVPYEGSPTRRPSCVYALDGISEPGVDTVEGGEFSLPLFFVIRCYVPVWDDLLIGGELVPVSDDFGAYNTGSGLGSSCSGCVRLREWDWLETVELSNGSGFFSASVEVVRFNDENVTATATDGFFTNACAGGGTSGNSCTNPTLYDSSHCNGSWELPCSFPLAHNSPYYVGDHEIWSSYPTFNFGEPYEGPFDPCSEMEPGSFERSRDGGETWSSFSLAAGIVDEGDRVRFSLSSASLPDAAADAGLVTVEYRWTASQVWADLLTFDPDVDEFPRSFTVFRGSGGFAPASGFQLACTYDGETVYWDFAGGWEAPESYTVCSSLTVAAAALWDDDASAWVVLGVDEDTILIRSGDLVRWSFSHSDDPLLFDVPIEVNFLRGWQVLGTLESGSSPPLYLEATVDTPGSTNAGFMRLDDVGLRCVELGGPMEYDPETGGFNRAPVDGGGETSCYARASDSMSLSSPASWVRGAGRMGVCLAEVLFVPEDGAVDEAWTSFTDDATTSVPIAWVYESHQMAVDSYSGMASGAASTSSDCFTVVPPPDVMTGDTGGASGEFCAATEFDTGGSIALWKPIRTVLGVVAWVVFASWLGALVWASANGAPAQPEQLKLF